MNRAADSSFATWTAPECPFAIEYSARVVDDIRLAVVDAFFSLPRGGVEMGGILLGSFGTDRLQIVDSVPLECEHAFGPSFTLSPNDLAKLEAQLAGLQHGSARPAGWYHSHTRSGIFLSDADLEIHRRFFPESWQVALVLRPHAFEPVRAGFFFREADGSFHATATYQEFLLDPLTVRPLPQPPRLPATSPSPSPRNTPSSTPLAPVLEAQAVRAPSPPAVPPEPVLPTVSELPPLPALAPIPEAREIEPLIEAEAPMPPLAALEPPRFLPEPQTGQRRWAGLVWVLVGAAIGMAGFWTRQQWWPRAVGLAKQVAPGPVPAAGLGLTTSDAGGQLQIRWDRNSPPIRQGTGALLMIVDGGGTPQARGLNATLLQSGGFTYARQTGQVDVTLTVHQPGGSEIRETAAFIGAEPVNELKKQEELTERAVRLQTDLNKQAARTKKLEKNLEDMRLELQKRRMENQIPDPDKK